MNTLELLALVEYKSSGSNSKLTLFPIHFDISYFVAIKYWRRIQDLCVCFFLQLVFFSNSKKISVQHSHTHWISLLGILWYFNGMRIRIFLQKKTNCTSLSNQIYWITNIIYVQVFEQCAFFTLICLHLIINMFAKC